MREQADVIFVDMHAEATSEKAAMAWYLDLSTVSIITSKVAAIFPTKTVGLLMLNGECMITQKSPRIYAIFKLRLIMLFDMVVCIIILLLN